MFITLIDLIGTKTLLTARLPVTVSNMQTWSYACVKEFFARTHIAIHKPTSSQRLKVTITTYGHLLIVCGAPWPTTLMGQLKSFPLISSSSPSPAVFPFPPLTETVSDCPFLSSFLSFSASFLLTPSFVLYPILDVVANFGCKLCCLCFAFLFRFSTGSRSKLAFWPTNQMVPKPFAVPAISAVLPLNWALLR